MRSHQNEGFVGVPCEWPQMQVYISRSSSAHVRCHPWWPQYLNTLGPGASIGFTHDHNQDHVGHFWLGTTSWNYHVSTTSLDLVPKTTLSAPSDMLGTLSRLVHQQNGWSAVGHCGCCGDHTAPITTDIPPSTAAAATATTAMWLSGFLLVHCAAVESVVL